MDDNAKQAPSYQLDQEILDARGIKMTVEEVAGLPTCKYSERVRGLHLSEEDLAFLKGLRRRIKNRLASQNSRRRSVEHLRRLTRELRVVRACRHDALAERRGLLATRDQVRDKCNSLHKHLHAVLEERQDKTEIPSIEVEIIEPKVKIKMESVDKPPIFEKLEKLHPLTEITEKDSKRRAKMEFPINDRHEPNINELNKPSNVNIKKELSNKIELPSNVNIKRELLKNNDFCNERTELNEHDFVDIHDKHQLDKIVKREFLNHEDDSNEFLEHYEIEDEDEEALFECNIEKLVQKSVNHLYNDTKKKVFAKTVFISNETLSTDIKNMVFKDGNIKNMVFKEGNINDMVFKNKNNKTALFKDGNNKNPVFKDGDIKNMIFKDGFIKNMVFKEGFKDLEELKKDAEEKCEVLNLCVKENKRKSHGRKQLAPRRIAYYNDCDDGVLDLKVKKEAQ